MLLMLLFSSCGYDHAGCGLLEDVDVVDEVVDVVFEGGGG